jgi:hypothetical protein
MIKPLFYGMTSQMDVWHDGVKGLIQTNNMSPSDLMVSTGDGKTLELQTPIWDDLRVVPGMFQFGGGQDPTIDTWQPGGAGRIFRVYAFQTSHVDLPIQLSHQYVEGSAYIFIFTGRL